MKEKKLWFKAKRYGYGWYPSSWQGWAVIAVYLGLMVILSLQIDTPHPNSQMLVRFLLPGIVLTIVLVAVAYAKGEPARWRWGDKDTKDTHEK